jgi:hypothetical protein
MCTQLLHICGLQPLLRRILAAAFESAGRMCLVAEAIHNAEHRLPILVQHNTDTGLCNAFDCTEPQILSTHTILTQNTAMLPHKCSSCNGFWIQCTAARGPRMAIATVIAFSGQLRSNAQFHTHKLSTSVPCSTKNATTQYAPEQTSPYMQAQRAAVVKAAQHKQCEPPRNSNSSHCNAPSSTCPSLQ